MSALWHALEMIMKVHNGMQFLLVIVGCLAASLALGVWYTGTRVAALQTQSETVARQTIESVKKELAAARTRLQAADRLATLGMLSAGIAHEIRNPLAAIRACLDEAPELLDDLQRAGIPAAGLEAHLAASHGSAEHCCDESRPGPDVTGLHPILPLSNCSNRSTDGVRALTSGK